MYIFIVPILVLSTLVDPISTNSGALRTEILSQEPISIDLQDRKDEPEKERQWFFLYGMVSAYPKLQSERLLKDIFDPIVSTIAPGYDGTRTFTDLRNKGLLMPPHIAFGRILSDKFALSIHGGYSEGVRRTKRRENSIFLGVPLSTRVSIRRYSTYLGVDLDYYPFKMAKLQQYTNWGERLKAAKPTLGIRINYNRTGYDARARMALGWFNRGVAVHLHNHWALPGITLVAGFDIPLNKRNVMAINAGYTWFKKQTHDFDGPAFTLAWKYFF
ncbi:MAG TPA: hypothetical protein PLY90_04355 [Candidatus Hydrogenedentes bacterium]|jgi:hypothetical protein|nr:MAG: hypothetical protein BWY07_01390 [Candidatus Hydrogenedentes bacterium ADurb.Bin170]HOD95599.1 hypothetical protein [Candidatus Hydrogenedentota bacterium]HOR51051.1 hypothetical protein [Candidatus Hydrogenedentota bacterium]HPK24960.1 hypothetical protein [Candidatus Hydrogenedentota bacterium]HPX86500.1 hypothetical protein [Candidatus Hydrogenedentota bacterium]